MRNHFLTLSALLALASCAAPPPPPAPTPIPTPKPVVVPPVQPSRPTGDWTDWPLTPGDWAYRRDDRGSIGLFGANGADAIVTLRCDQSRQRIYLARAGSGAGTIVIRSSSSMKEFVGSPTGGAQPYIATEIMPSDPILDAMIYSRGRIALEVSGQPPIAIPAWAEIARVVEDCRR